MIENLRKTLASLNGAWHRFWFTPTDPIVVSTLRVFAGGMLFYTLLVWGVDLQAFFSQSGGWQSADLAHKLQFDQWALSFWWFVPDDMLWACHYTCLAIVFAYWIGLGTAVTKWLSLAIVVSYASRVSLANYNDRRKSNDENALSHFLFPIAADNGDRMQPTSLVSRTSRAR